MDNSVRSHFRQRDPVLFRIIDSLGEIEQWQKPDNAFFALCREIINQQLSEKAGATIVGRFLALFAGKPVTAKALLAIPDETLRSAGMSWSKVSYLKNIACAVQTQAFGLDGLEGLERLEDEEVIIALTKIKGVGRWTAEMFLMFVLGREDVFSHGDLGLKNAIKKIYGFKKDPTKRQVERIAKRWVPYRTWACRILWRSLEK